MQKVEKYLESGMPVYRIKMSAGRVSVNYIVFHELDLSVTMPFLMKNECLENLEMTVPSNIQGGKAKEQTLTREIEHTKRIPLDAIQEIEIIESSHADYEQIKQYVATYIAQVKANKANKEKELS